MTNAGLQVVPMNWEKEKIKDHIQVRKLPPIAYIPGFSLAAPETFKM